MGKNQGFLKGIWRAAPSPESRSGPYWPHEPQGFHSTPRGRDGAAIRDGAAGRCGRSEFDENSSHFLGFHPVPARPLPGRVPGRHARAGLCRGQERRLRPALLTRQSASAARSGVKPETRPVRPCGVERTCDPRDGGGDRRSRPVCPERRPGCVGPRQEPRETGRQFHGFDLPFARAGGEAGRAAEGNRSWPAHACRACRTPFTRESNRSGARRRKPRGSSVSCCSMSPSPVRPSWITD